MSKHENTRKHMSLLHSQNTTKKSNNSVFDGGSQNTPTVFGGNHYHISREKDTTSKLNSDLVAVSMIGAPTSQRKVIRQGLQTQRKIPALKYLVEENM